MLTVSGAPPRATPLYGTRDVVVGRDRMARAHVNHFGVASETGYTTSSSDAYHFVPLRGNQARIP